MTLSSPPLNISCERCRKRKQRCNRVRPSCATCISADIPCVYSQRMEKRGPRPGRAAQLEARIYEVEQQIQAHYSLSVKEEKQTPSPTHCGGDMEENQITVPIRIRGTPKSPSRVDQDMQLPFPQDRLIKLIDTISQCLTQPVHPIHFGELRAAILAGTAPPPVVDAIIAIALPIVSKDPADLDLAVNHFYRAQAFLNTGNDGGTILARTCILITCSAYAFPIATVWMYQGIVIRSCMAAGLHMLDSPNPRGCVMSKENHLSRDLRSLEAMSLRRLWWSVYIHDVIASLVTHRPRGIDDRDLEIRLPGDEASWRSGVPPAVDPPMFDHEELDYIHSQDPCGAAYASPPLHIHLPPELLPLFPVPHATSAPTFNRESNNGGSTKEAPLDYSFANYVRLVIITGRICNYTLRVRSGVRIHNPNSPLSEFAILELALRRWLHSLPPGTFSPLPPPGNIAFYSLGLLHLATIALHRTRLQVKRSDPLVPHTSSDTASLHITRHSALAISTLISTCPPTPAYPGPFHYRGPPSSEHPSPFIGLLAFNAAVVHADTLVSTTTVEDPDRALAYIGFYQCRRAISLASIVSDPVRIHAELLAGLESSIPNMPVFPSIESPRPSAILFDDRMVQYLNEMFGQDVWKEGQYSLYDELIDMGNLSNLLELPFDV